MTYISKNIILAAYKKLSEMSPDPSAQGATQRISAIRHFFALDSFFKLYDRDCDTKQKSDKDKFSKLVGDICDVCENLYTTNFYYPLKQHKGDYCVGSNFYSAGQVKSSLVDSSMLFDYPQRGNAPLMKVQDGILRRTVSLYGNIKKYLTSTDFIVALVLWLMRNKPLKNNGTLCSNIYNTLSHSYTNDLLDILFENRKDIEEILDNYHLTFTETAYIIQDNDIERLFDNVSKNKIDISSRQIIYYGAPGTGKSHRVKELLENVPGENIFRTTFHPDSDYSTFVGAYKPTMENDEPLYNKGQLISKLTELNTQGVSYAAQKFGAKYWYSLRRLTPFDEKEILQACGMKESFTDEIDKGVAVGEALLQRKDSRIVYGFVPQVFLNAYTQAYKKPKENIYLIIEEINRGNCAQIFGDLFQLLDRDENGISEYPIKADTDVKTFLESELGVDKPGIKDGELCLPSNLYIYATMNTSDQSLFPIDSAFKRRWDWEYEPIKYENTDWVIDIQGEKYLWTSFQKEVNRRIFEATNSEDKQLGDYFVNPRDGVITENILVNKILFYLWNDVCKDGEGDIFKVSDTEDVSFSELYIDKGKLIKLMDYLHVEKSMNGDKDQSSENEEESDEEGATTPQSV